MCCPSKFFSEGWGTDVVEYLKLDASVLSAPYGSLPDLKKINFARDVVLCWNGTTSGVCLPDGDFIPADREGLVLCDATSAAFAMDLPFAKLDVVTWSWQKVLGGEGAHGMIALSLRAVQRLENFRPPWPLPKLFRLIKGGKFIDGIFAGETINTPSMLCVEDALDGLRRADCIGGLPVLMQRTCANLAAIEAFVAHSDWAAFLAHDPATRSSTSICLTIKVPWFTLLSAELQAAAVNTFINRGLEVDVKPGLSLADLRAVIGNYDGLAIRSNTKVTKELLDVATRLKVVGRAAAGGDAICLVSVDEDISEPEPCWRR